MFDHLPIEPADPLLALLSDFRADPRAHKLDLGVGVYRNEKGLTPVMAAIKMAEDIIHDQQITKGYIGLRGNLGFLKELGELVFGSDPSDHPHCVSLQTLGGTGAVRLSYDMIYAANPSARLWLPLPSWSHHISLSAAAGLNCQPLPYLADCGAQIGLDAMFEQMRCAKMSDVIVIQGHGHNPTGIDLSLDDWRRLTEFINDKKLIPLIDLAYLGLVQDIDNDAEGYRYMFENVPQALLSMSCSKTFGLYAERTGALFVKAQSEEIATKALDFLTTTARNYYSMPADAGAALVHEVLRHCELKARWLDELSIMRARMDAKRIELGQAMAHPDPILNGRGMFTRLDISPDLVNALKSEFGIYLEPEGRINLAGFQEGDVKNLTDALNKLD